MTIPTYLVAEAAVKFHQADLCASQATGYVKVLFDMETAQYRAKGFTDEQIASNRASKCDVFRDAIVNTFTDECPFRWSTNDDLNNQQRDGFLNEAPLLRAVIWDLRCDYGTWPSYAEVLDRLCTWYDADRLLADGFLTLSSIGAVDGVEAIYPAHKPPVGRPSRRINHRRWMLTDAQMMAREEQSRQWRIAMGEDGLRHRVGVHVFFANVNVLPPFVTLEASL